MDEELFASARVIAQLRIGTRERQAREQGAEQLTSEHIRSEVEKVLADSMFSPLGAPGRERLIAELEASFKTFVGVARLMAGKGHRPWLPKRKAEIQWEYWKRYRDHLVRDQGWADAAIGRLDEFTDIIVNQIPDPMRAETWNCRGLVVGHVQSGKTSNYTGLICKAADAGYKVIVVLAGMHNSLRTQTQIRLEEGFLGAQTPSGRAGAAENMSAPVGVGMHSAIRANYATTRAETGDFNKRAANHYGVSLSASGPPVLFVIKKNGVVLKNLISWVSSKGNAKDHKGKGYVTGVPLLVIDDEADQGSIDTKAKERDSSGGVDEEHSPTILNKRIRELLALFDRHAYVAYTATPFANVLIHMDNETTALGRDLFPADFIVSLPAPSNYVGPVRAFGLEADESREQQDPLPIIRDANDWLDDPDEPEDGGWMPLGHKKNHVPAYRGDERVPPTLAQAIAAFVLTTAARKARGQGKKHNTMLIHVTRFTEVQHRVVEQVKAELSRLKAECSFGGAVWGELESLWKSDFEPTTKAIGEADCKPLSWPQVEPHVVPAVESIWVNEVNGSAGDILDYETYKDVGLNVIAVGGDKLSRGLTLEGLSVSYFLRASRMYDTLMQMGRWFGYRPGYLDLCRIYTTKELVEWFEHITEANEELRDEFNAMSMARQTPEDYGHRVRSHPVLLVTSQVKMRDGERVRVSFAGTVSETVSFYRDARTIRSNFEAVQNLITHLGGSPRANSDLPDRFSTPRRESGRLVWRNVSPDAVVTFLEGYRAHAGARSVRPKELGRYIEAQNARGELTTWTVALLSGQGVANAELQKLCDVEHPVTRRWVNGADTTPGAPFRIRRVVSPSDESLDLSTAEYKAALERTAKPAEGAATASAPSGIAVREVRPSTRGLLLIYPLEPGVQAKGPAPSDLGNDGPPVTAFALSFPGSKTGVLVDYLVNSVWAQQEYGDDGE